jgi:hypothetical protein
MLIQFNGFTMSSLPENSRGYSIARIIKDNGIM